MYYQSRITFRDTPPTRFFFRRIAEEAFLLKLIVTVISKILRFFTDIKPSL